MPGEVFYGIFLQESDEILNLTVDYEKSITFAAGKSYTTSSRELPQVRKEARVNGCSGAI